MNFKCNTLTKNYNYHKHYFITTYINQYKNIKNQNKFKINPKQSQFYSKFQNISSNHNQKILISFKDETSNTKNEITEFEQSSPPQLLYRIGHGFDLHRLEVGFPLIIGGINIPHVKGCDAHSDGDVLLHCIVDAILGALGLPDIGQIFPDTDPKWKGASSDTFIKEAVQLMKEKGYKIGNLDATIIAQKPKLSPHKEKIKSNLCKLLEAHPTTINIKAKTHEKVDSIGEERSIACHTVVMLMKIS